MALTKLRICIIFEFIPFTASSGSSPSLGSFWESSERELVLVGERDLELWLSLDLAALRGSIDGGFGEMAVKSAMTSRTRRRSRYSLVEGCGGALSKHFPHGC